MNTLGKKREYRSCLALKIILSIALGALTPLSAEAIYAGSSALGSPYVVQLSTPTGLCSGTLVQPQILVTAAHCLIKSGSTLNPGDIKVYEPGVNTQMNNWEAKGVSIFSPPNFFNNTTRIEPQDIAFVVLDKKLGSLSVIKLANFNLSQSLISNGATFTAYGYGRISANTQTSIPQKFMIKPTTQKRFQSFIGFERTYINYINSENGSTCPGDSGGPTIAEYNGSVYLVSIHSGGRGPCSKDPQDVDDWGSTGTIAGEFENLYWEALNYLKLNIPNPISNPTILISSGIATLSWQTSGPESNWIKYLVLNSSQKELCNTSSNNCKVDLVPGQNSFTIIATSGLLKSEPINFNYQLVIPPVSEVNLVSDGLQGKLSWSTSPNTNNLISSYIVEDFQGNEFCRTVLLSCVVPLTIGTNNFRIYPLWGTSRGTPGQITINLQNALLPNIEFIKIRQNEIEVKLGTISSYGNSRPESVSINIFEGSSDNPTCTLVLLSESCKIRHQPQNVTYYISLISNLGRTNRDIVFEWYGSSYTQTILASRLRILTLNKDLTNLLSKNPGYKQEIVELLNSIPALSEDLVIDDLLQKQLLELESLVSALREIVITKPRKVTLLCVKGNNIKSVTSRDPKCPLGYKKRRG